ncbi:hypothetical protein ACIBJC_12030 [Streptomyces sp. NPDC050509]|uniref:hypothetical protein n=1 Tax=Streptomyces sp. NPDC050509 TaxID=3365620 RepID=UPI0037B68E9C
MDSSGPYILCLGDGRREDGGGQESPVLLVHGELAPVGGHTLFEDLAPLKRLLPAGAATELVVNAWEDDAVADSLILLVPTLGWVVVALALASRLFRWESRR